MPCQIRKPRVRSAPALALIKRSCHGVKSWASSSWFTVRFFAPACRIQVATAARTPARGSFASRPNGPSAASPAKNTPEAPAAPPTAPSAATTAANARRHSTSNTPSPTARPSLSSNTSPKNPRAATSPPPQNSVDPKIRTASSADEPSPGVRANRNSPVRSSSRAAGSSTPLPVVSRSIIVWRLFLTNQLFDDPRFSSSTAGGTVVKSISAPGRDGQSAGTGRLSGS